MATWNDVARLALALPETSEGKSHGNRSWLVRDKTFAWERPLRKSDLEALGAGAPKGAILGVRVHDLDEKEALLATRPKACFTTPHFDGYPAVLVQLGKLGARELRELLELAWHARAPGRLIQARRG